MPSPASTPSPQRTWLGPALVAFVAAIAAISTLADPGLTCDEYYDVQAGKSLVAAWRNQGLDFFRADRVDENFGHLTPHPPLGRWLLGWTHHLFDTQPDEPYNVSILAARFAPALAFGGLVLLAGLAAAPVCGQIGATSASLAVALSPRVFAEAHFATLDTFTALGQVAALLAVAVALERGGQPWRFALAGCVWGLALAIKLPAALVAPPVAIWLLWQMRLGAIVRLLAWSGAGLVVFFLAWPWLWYDTAERLQAYLATATERQVLHVFYRGSTWADVEAPWHYPWVMLLATLPTTLLLLGVVGIGSGGRRWLSDRRLSLVAIVFVFVLVVFSAPGVPVYDGVRLFLIAFPLWSVAVGVGAEWIVNGPRLARFPRAARVAGLAALVLSPAIGLIAIHPYELSYYSATVGGLPGAERLGFETTYWGDSVSSDLLQTTAELAPRQHVVYAPHLAPFQAAAVTATSPALTAAEVTLVGWDVGRPADTADSRYALVYRRRADWDSVASLVEGAQVVAEVSRHGVWLARLYELPAPSAANSAPQSDGR